MTLANTPSGALASTIDPAKMADSEVTAGNTIESQAPKESALEKIKKQFEREYGKKEGDKMFYAWWQKERRRRRKK